MREISNGKRVKLNRTRKQMSVWNRRWSEPGFQARNGPSPGASGPHDMSDPQSLKLAQSCYQSSCSMHIRAVNCCKSPCMGRNLTILGPSDAVF